MRKLSLVLVPLSSCLWFGASFAETLLSNEEVVAQTMKLAFNHPKSPFTEAGFYLVRAVGEEQLWFSNLLERSPDWWTVEFEFKFKGSTSVSLGECDLEIEDLGLGSEAAHSTHTYQIYSCEATDPTTGERVFPEVSGVGLAAGRLSTRLIAGVDVAGLNFTTTTGLRTARSFMVVLNGMFTQQA